MNIKERVWGAGGKLFSVLGLVAGTAIAGAAEYYQASGGNIGSWEPYAGAAAIAVAGLFLKKKV